MKKIDEFECIHAEVSIHPDGDVYVKHKGVFHYIGGLSENDISPVPNDSYKKAKEILYETKDSL